ncbi:Kinase suppressor of Ras 2 [Araneus ventricosus]|uniref:Kinase suppressor of Ras 2 n=1 Tax=Araneus ventricosus TaxID=182803 RepID=A0A4Y2L035_ARAVE|nr:Kinase suppressor of Ras 2 [Araneus ventricosus]
MCQNKARSCPRRSMNDIKKRLSRTLSGPRRCVKCQKMVYFSIYRCKLCGELTHKHCLYHANQSCKSSVQDIPLGFPNMKTAECEDWRSPASPREYWLNKQRHHTDSPSSCDAEEAYQNELRHPSPSVAMAGLLKIVQWLSHRKRTREMMGKTSAEKHIKGKFGLHIEDKQTKKKLKTLIKNYQKQMVPPGYYSQYQQQQYLLRTHREAHINNQQLRTRGVHKQPVNEGGSDIMSPRSSVSSYSGSSFMSPASTPDIESVRLRRDKLVKQASIKWERDVIKSSIIANGSPSVTVKKPSEHKTLSDRPKHVTVSPKPSVKLNEAGWMAGNKNSLFGHQRNVLDAKTTTLTFARPPCLSKAKTLSVESREAQNESLCATWPPAGKAGTILEEIVDEAEADCIEEADETCFTLSDFRSDSQSGEESLKEWYIPFGDIEFRERIRHGRKGDIYKGRWYGEVLIYTIHQSCSQELNQFLDEVAQMGMIRHENIVLFMGACIEPQRLAVITSMRKGPTLYEYLHLKRHKLPFHSKHNIARQIAQGMGYLHAKDIVHKKLNSKNIILECRVKVCIMDHGMADQQLDRCDYGCIPRGHLSYISPELMSSLQIDPPRIYTTKAYTQESDLFAFGSLLYELLAERFAFHDQPPHSIIWQVSSGKAAPLHNFRFINGLKTLIKRCWSRRPEQRPPFSEIGHILQENVSHHRRHSCSEPDLLHHTGQSSSRGLCT